MKRDYKKRSSKKRYSKKRDSKKRDKKRSGKSKKIGGSGNTLGSSSTQQSSNANELLARLQAERASRDAKAEASRAKGSPDVLTRPRSSLGVSQKIGTMDDLLNRESDDKKSDSEGGGTFDITELMEDFDKSTRDEDAEPVSDISGLNRRNKNKEARDKLAEEAFAYGLARRKSWKEMKDERGVYWFNELTCETVNDEPDDLLLASGVKASGGKAPPVSGERLGGRPSQSEQIYMIAEGAKGAKNLRHPRKKTEGSGISREEQVNYREALALLEQMRKHPPTRVSRSVVPPPESNTIIFTPDPRLQPNQEIIALVNEKEIILVMPKNIVAGKELYFVKSRDTRDGKPKYYAKQPTQGPLPGVTSLESQSDVDAARRVEELLEAARMRMRSGQSSPGS